MRTRGARRLLLDGPSEAQGWKGLAGQARGGSAVTLAGGFHPRCRSRANRAACAPALRGAQKPARFERRAGGGDPWGLTRVSYCHSLAECRAPGGLTSLVELRSGSPGGGRRWAGPSRGWAAGGARRLLLAGPGLVSERSRGWRRRRESGSRWEQSGGWAEPGASRNRSSRQQQRSPSAPRAAAPRSGWRGRHRPPPCGSAPR